MGERSGTFEAGRLIEAREGAAPWRKWGPYLSERQCGTVREGYSQDGNAWNDFTHDQARSRGYHWGEDGLAGIPDEKMAVADMVAEMVLGDKLALGSGNANKQHWYRAGEALARADRAWLAKLVTRRVRPEDFAHALERQLDDIKVVLQFAEA